MNKIDLSKEELEDLVDGSVYNIREEVYNGIRRYVIEIPITEEFIQDFDALESHNGIEPKDETLSMLNYELEKAFNEILDKR